MTREVGCPWPQYPDCTIELPDEWLGEHAQRRDQAIEAAAEYKSESITRLSVAIALLENWSNLPGIDGPPEQWDFTQVPLEILSWLDEAVLGDFAKALTVPKVSSDRSGNGQTEMGPTK